MLAYKLKALEACLFPACHIWSKEDGSGVGRYCERDSWLQSLLLFFLLAFYIVLLG